MKMFRRCWSSEVEREKFESARGSSSSSSQKKNWNFIFSFSSQAVMTRVNKSNFLFHVLVRGRGVECNLAKKSCAWALLDRIIISVEFSHELSQTLSKKKTFNFHSTPYLVECETPLLTHGILHRKVVLGEEKVCNHERNRRREEDGNVIQYRERIHGRNLVDNVHVSKLLLLL